MTTIVQDDHLTAGAWAACATTTNLFINGCSLHGSHQVIILEILILIHRCDVALSLRSI